MTITSIMTDIGNMFTGSIDWVKDVGEAIMSNPLLEFCVLIPFIGLGIGYFKRLLHL